MEILKLANISGEILMFREIFKTCGVLSVEKTKDFILFLWNMSFLTGQENKTTISILQMRVCRRGCQLGTCVKISHIEWMFGSPNFVFNRRSKNQSNGQKYKHVVNIPAQIIGLFAALETKLLLCDINLHNSQHMTISTVPLR